MIFCLFCADRSLPLHHDHNPVKLEKSESGDDGENESAVVAVGATGYLDFQLKRPSVLRFTKEEDSAIQVQLKAFFILRNVLNISKETLCQFLRSEGEKEEEEDNENINNTLSSDSELWAQVQVCLSCEQLVSKYYRLLKLTQIGMEFGSDLDRIGKELREKMRECKGVQESRSTSLWAKIRRHALKRDSPDVDKENDSYSSSMESQPQVKLEPTDIPHFQSEGEEWDISNTLVKVEVVDSESTTTTFPNCLDKEDDSISSEKPKKLRYKQSFRLQCPHCPYKTGNTDYYESHLQIHVEGSPAIPCVECGVHVLPKYRYSHKRSHRLKNIRKAIKASLPKAPAITQPKIPPPTKIQVKKGKYKSKGAKISYTSIKVKNQPHLKCLDCPFMVKGKNSKSIETHILLHERGSGAIPCPECGCYQAAQSLDGHRKSHFTAVPLLRGVRRSRKRLLYHRHKPYLTCPDCPFRHKMKKNFEQHLNYHEPGSEAKACKECGVYVLPKFLRSHRRFCDFGIGLNETKGGRKKLQMRHVDSSHPSYIFFLSGKGKGKHYRCRKCTFQTNDVESIKSHIELHEEDKQGEEKVVATPSPTPVATPDEVSTDKVNKTLPVTDSPADTEAKSSEETRHAHATDFVETVIKTEEVDLGYFSIPTFSMADDTNPMEPPPGEEEQFEVDSVPIPILPPPPTLSGVEPNCPQRPRRSKLSKYDHKCPYCPYTTGENSFSSFTWHMKLHAKTSEALVIPCPDCGVFIRSETLEAHRERHVRKALLRAQRAEERSTLKKNTSTKKKTEEKRPNPNFSTEQIGKHKRDVLHRCHHCAYTVRSSESNMLVHLKVHEPDSTAIVCPEPDCGIYILPEKMKMHYGMKHRFVSKATRNRLKEMKRKKPPPNPDYSTTIINGEYSRFKSKLYKCRRCYFESKFVRKMEDHVELHKEGSGAGPCEECGRFMLAQEVKLHLDLSHPNALQSYPVIPKKKKPSSSPKYKCAECPYHAKKVKLYDHHLQLHCEGSGAVQCENCGCYVNPQLVSHHSYFCGKWRSSQEDTEIKVEVKSEPGYDEQDVQQKISI